MKKRVDKLTGIEKRFEKRFSLDKHFSVDKRPSSVDKPRGEQRVSIDKTRFEKPLVSETVTVQKPAKIEKHRVEKQGSSHRGRGGTKKHSITEAHLEKLTGKVFDQEEYFSSKGYTIGRIIAGGTFSKVRVLERDDGAVFAMKMISLIQTSKVFCQRFLPREMKMLLEIDHPNIVTTEEIFCLPNFVCAVMEFAERGTILDYIVRHKVISESKGRVFFQQIVDGVSYLHDRGIVHRDLKLENILLFKDTLIKITDLGFARYTQGRIDFMTEITSKMGKEITNDVVGFVDKDGGTQRFNCNKNVKMLQDEIMKTASRNVGDDRALEIEEIRESVESHHDPFHHQTLTPPAPKQRPRTHSIQNPVVDHLAMHVKRMSLQPSTSKPPHLKETPPSSAHPSEVGIQTLKQQLKSKHLLTFPTFGSNKGYPSIAWVSESYCGSRAYASPEVLTRTPYNCKANDIWSMGCILFGMVCGMLPFKQTDFDINERLKPIKFPKTPEISDECKSLLWEMLEPTPEARIKTHDLVKHGWLTGDPYDT